MSKLKRIPIILLHGALGSAAQLDPLFMGLEHEFEVHTFNFSGHGGLDLPSAFTTDVFVNELVDFIDQKELAPVYIFGYSMGGYVALQTAITHPGLISKIMTLGTKWKWTPEIADQEITMLDPDVIEVKVPKFAAQLKSRHALQDWKLIMRQTAELMRWLGEGNGIHEGALSGVKIPILITLGTLDQMVTPDESIHVTEQLSNANFEVFDGFRHPIEMVDTQVLTDRIKSFFSKVS